MTGLSPLQKYKQRPEEIEDITYLQFPQRYDFCLVNHIYE
jgi:hypothetical protein